MQDIDIVKGGIVVEIPMDEGVGRGNGSGTPAYVVNEEAGKPEKNEHYDSLAGSVWETLFGIDVRSGIEEKFDTSTGDEDDVSNPADFSLQKQRGLSNGELVVRSFDVTGGSEIILSGKYLRTLNPKTGEKLMKDENAIEGRVLSFQVDRVKRKGEEWEVEWRDGAIIRYRKRAVERALKLEASDAET